MVRSRRGCNSSSVRMWLTREGALAQLLGQGAIVRQDLAFLVGVALEAGGEGGAVDRCCHGTLLWRRPYLR